MTTAALGVVVGASLGAVAQPLLDQRQYVLFGVNRTLTQTAHMHTVTLSPAVQTITGTSLSDLQWVRAGLVLKQIVNFFVINLHELAVHSEA